MFHGLLLEKDIIKRERIDKKVKKEIEFDTRSDSKSKYKVRKSWDNAVYIKMFDGYLLELYYLNVWKGYLEKKTP